jgi:hypothetical protein
MADPQSTEIDGSRPNVARMYDYWLGGKDHFEADRTAARNIEAVFPRAALACRDNRVFLQRAVRLLTSRGIRQFIDIGSGLPTAENTHQVAQAAVPGSRVAYVDNDPVVCVYAQAMLAEESNGAIAVQGDIREPDAILADPAIKQHIDFGEPLAVLCVAVLHFVGEAERPYDALKTLTDAMPPGSYLALTHITPEEVAADARETAQEVYAGASAPITPRTRAEVSGFFAGLDLVAPGIVDVTAWHPEIPPARRPGVPPGKAHICGGIGRKRT